MKLWFVSLPMPRKLPNFARWWQIAKYLISYKEKHNFHSLNTVRFFQNLASMLRATKTTGYESIIFLGAPEHPHNANEVMTNKTEKLSRRKHGTNIVFDVHPAKPKVLGLFCPKLLFTPFPWPYDDKILHSGHSWYNLWSLKKLIQYVQ